MNELRTLTILQEQTNEHVLRYYGSFRQSGTFNLLLQYADRGNLLDFFQKTRQPQSINEVCQLWKSIFGILQGVHCLHNRSPDDYSSAEYRG